MAKGQKNKTPKVAESEKPKQALPPPEDDAALARREDEEADDDAESDTEEDAETTGADAGPVVPGDTEGAEVDGEGEELAAAQLGTDRYVLAAFFAAGMLLTYVLGMTIHGVWATVANKDWFNRTLPALAAIGDDEKYTIGMVIGGITALVVVLRTYRNPELRTWADEVAGELAKVKWPTKKDVTNSTFVVITATAVATLYLALLDRFWAFVTNLVYGDGS